MRSGGIPASSTLQACQRRPSCGNSPPASPSLLGGKGLQACIENQKKTGFSRRGKVANQERPVSGYGFSHTATELESRGALAPEKRSSASSGANVARTLLSATSTPSATLNTRHGRAGLKARVTAPIGWGFSPGGEGHFTDQTLSGGAGLQACIEKPEKDRL